MNLRLLALVLALAASPVAGDGVPTFTSGRELFALCLSEDPAQHGYCIGFLTASVDAQRLVPAASQQFCEPRWVTTKGLQRAFIEWAHRARAALDHPAGTGVIDAMRARWPCPELAS